MEGILICRVSDAKQADGYSLDAQEREGTSYAQREGINLVEKFVFQETASKAQQRKKFDEILSFVYGRPSNKKLAVLAEKHDRLLRNHKSAADVQHLIESGRIQVHFFKLGKVLDQASDPSEFLVDDVMTSVNSYQARRIGREAVKGMEEKARQGWLPSMAPLGYLNVERSVIGKHSGKDATEKIIVRDPDVRMVRWAQRMFELRSEGFSFREVRDRCKAEKVVPPERLAHFHPSLVESTIKNPFYAGRFVWRGVEYQGKHELIIPEAVIERIRDLDVRDTRRRRKRDGALAGWLRCAECGCRVTYDPKTKATGRTFEYYRCANGRGAHPVLRYVSEEKIVSGFATALDAISLSDMQADQISEALNATHARVQAAQRAEIEAFTQALQELEGAEDELYLDLKRGRVDEDGYKRQLARIRSERQRFVGLLAEAQRAIDGAYLHVAKKILELATRAKSLWDSRNARERRELLDKILSNPQLDGATVRYDFKKPFRAIAKMARTSNVLPGTDLNRGPGG
jgi:site-specific DNA recombinase